MTIVQVCDVLALPDFSVLSAHSQRELIDRLGPVLPDETLL